MAETITPNSSLDCRGMQCPMPIAKTRIAIKRLRAGEVLEVLATDPGSVPDLQAFAAETGHELLAQRQEGGVYKHYLRKVG